MNNNTCLYVYIYILASRSLTERNRALIAEDWKDGRVVKNVYYSDRGPKFNPQYPRRRAHNCLGLQLLGISNTLTSTGMHTCGTYIHIHIPRQRGIECERCGLERLLSG